MWNYILKSNSITQASTINKVINTEPKQVPSHYTRAGSANRIPKGKS